MYRLSKGLANNRKFFLLKARKELSFRKVNLLIIAVSNIVFDLAEEK